MSAPLDSVTIERAHHLAARGIPLQQIANDLRVSRSALYLYGVRSGR